MANQLLDTLRDALCNFAVRSRKLASPMLRPFGPSSNPVTISDQELELLKSKLDRIRATLRAAEHLSIADESVALWLRELGDLECRAEDVLEELEYESLRAAKLEDFKVDLLMASTGKRKRDAACFLVSSFPPSRLRRKIDGIWSTYVDIASDRKRLKLRPGDGDRRADVCALLPSSSLPICQLHGRERDVEKVAELLLRCSDESASHGCRYEVVPIVGMAGVGKTALMQHVCGDEAVVSRFDIIRWVWVSQEFDVVQVTAKIAEAITKSRPDAREMSALHEVIVEHLQGKRCLLVLDDVWDDDPSHWDILKAPLHCCAGGSRVIVTTRSMKVARMVSPKVYQLTCLSDDSCWLICRRRAFHDRDVDVSQELMNIGKCVATKCRGLPLAAEAAGSALSTWIDETHWNEVLESYPWADEQVANRILLALKVSYDHLPMPLKRCFAFCSLFPKGYVFQKDVLVQLWIAQGFVEAREVSCPEDIGGGRCFDELVLRCFFQPSPCHDLAEGKFVMHDLYHELAQFVSGNECSRTEDRKLVNADEKARHLSLVPEESHSEEEIQLDSFCSHNLRTFLFVGRMEHKKDGIPFSLNMPCKLILALECLRALDLSNTNIEVLPMSVGSLIHLRYLGLENTRIQCLPEEIGALFQLQTIKVKQCSNLTHLPHGTMLLSNLRHLELPHCKVNMPSGIGLLTRLQTLPFFVVGRDSTGCGIEELSNLTDIRGELHISGMDNADDVRAAENAMMRNKVRLQKLTLQWQIYSYRYANVPNRVLESLRPHPNLEELTIKGFPGFRFPTWLGARPLCKLVTMDLKDCANCKELPPLGLLPSLKHLSIQSLASVIHVGREFCGDIQDSSSSIFGNGFPVLETLKFGEMHAWEEWTGVEDGDFPRLKYLTINRCCKLKVLPPFNSQAKLRIRYCEQLSQPYLSIGVRAGNWLRDSQTSCEFCCTSSADNDISIVEAFFWNENMKQDKEIVHIQEM